MASSISISLPEDDEEAIAQLTRIKGIGRWSAEIYLLFAEGRPDIWPAGDLAVMAGIGKILGLPERPDEKATRALSEPWRPASRRAGDVYLALLRQSRALTTLCGSWSSRRCFARRARTR